MTNLAIKVLEGKDEKVRHTASETVDFTMLTVSGTPTNATDVMTKAAVEGVVSGGSGVIGTPTDGSYVGGLLDFTASTKVADAIDPINVTLAKLAPAKPANLSAKTIALSSAYSALAAGTGSSHAVVTDAVRPTLAAVTNFYDGDAGTLSAEIDGSSVGSRALTTANDSGTYSALVITADVDFYLGQSGKENFWKALSANIAPTADLALGNHTFQLKHTTTGDTNLLSFWVDNPGTATTSNQSVNLSGVTSHYISGVPTLDAGTSLPISFRVSNAVGKHYNATKIADVTGSSTSTANVAPTGPYTEGQDIDLSAISVTVNSSAYVENCQVTLKGYNSKGVAGTPQAYSLGTRIDTVSSETGRKTSGSGQFPSTGYNGSFDATQSLKTSYTEELQMLNGRYQIPTGNYSANAPIAGPDYSTGMGSLDRWVTFNPTSFSSNSAFTLTINGSQGTWSGIETSGIKIYAKVEGATGWVDCNKSYPGTGSPSADGDAAMVFGSSTTTSKRVTFGSTVRSGQLIIRIGLPVGSDKKFQSISVGSIA
jgi:hypothetical protein